MFNPEKKVFDCPPPFYTEIVLDHCPQAGRTYWQIWKRRDHESKLVIQKSEIKNEFLTHYTKFENDLMLLVKEQLINVDETPNQFCIEMVSWDIDAEGLTLC